MKVKINLAGQQIGRLQVLQEAERKVVGKGRTERAWLCRCDCGVTKVFRQTVLVSRRSQSCGCLHADLAREKFTKYGRTPEYGIWSTMKSRCENQKVVGYKYYGARGIQVCAEWKKDFGAFLRDVGPRPTPKHSIDRIDPDGNYEPGNVRWATASEQRSNRRDSRRTA